MRIIDLLGLSVSNLLRRKLRTVLTVLGVLIGTASVVSMMALGIGLANLMQASYESYGSLTAIQVYRMYNYDSSSTEPNYITDEVIESLGSLEHVDMVSPKLTFSMQFMQGKYEMNSQVTGVTREYLEKLKIGQGSLPDPTDNSLQLVFGNMVVNNFYDSKSGEGYWDTLETPDVDVFNKTLFGKYESGYSYSENEENTNTNTKASKKYIMNVVGIIAGAEDEYNEHSYTIYADIDALKSQLRKIYGYKQIPGQPSNSKNKPYRYFIYDEAVVYCDDMNNVTAVQEAITNMGFQAYSNMEWLEQSKETTNMIQAVLGGIGAVSLLVAAIGIANTMMMSIYERTKEIGIMKVLGCDMGQIRNMFLIESGTIGFLGGCVGVGFSYGVAKILNTLGGAEALMGISGDIAQIPPWLAIGGIVFAIFIGVLAGLFPSLRAMRLSPLAAIRTDG